MASHMSSSHGGSHNTGHNIGEEDQNNDDGMLAGDKEKIAAAESEKQSLRAFLTGKTTESRVEQALRKSGLLLEEQEDI